MTAIIEFYQEYANDFPDKIAIQTLSEKMTYRTWSERVNQTANWLHSLSHPYHTVGILLPNGIPFLQLFTGASAAGWTAVPLDLKWNRAELTARLGLANPSIIITTSELHNEVVEFHTNVWSWEDCLSEILQFPTIRPNLELSHLPFYMGFTSGTTGKPKAFIRSQTSWAASFDCSRLDFHITKEDTVLIPGSLVHSHFLYGVISTLSIGGTVHLLEKFSSVQTVSLIDAEPINVLYVVPTMVAALLKESRQIRKKIKFLSSGAKWEEHSKTEIRKLFPNLEMYEFYGASELSFVSVLSDEDSKRKPNSVGKPCHNVEVQVRLLDGSLAGANEQGKIYVRSSLIFAGYLDERGDIKPFQQDANGWMTVDDMGYLDEEGYLYISGREKNMIIYGGINIFPEEIERVLAFHPLVDEVAVIGLYDSYWGQVVTAVVKGNATQKELKKLCREHLSSFKIPRKWVFVEELPHTLSGKIARAGVKQLLEGMVTSH
ncbi:acyl-CoA synthetase [Rhodococcus qingshengii]|nr:acyl-CoA synthetase [Rhodococcus qingshengii]